MFTLQHPLEEGRRLPPTLIRIKKDSIFQSFSVSYPSRHCWRVLLPSAVASRVARVPEWARDVRKRTVSRMLNCLCGAGSDAVGRINGEIQQAIARFENKDPEKAKLAAIELSAAVRAGSGCLNRFSASISGASAGVRLPSGGAAG